MNHSRLVLLANHTRIFFLLFFLVFGPLEKYSWPTRLGSHHVNRLSETIQLKTMPSSHNVQATMRCFVPGTMPCGCIGGYPRDHLLASPQPKGSCYPNYKYWLHPRIRNFVRVFESGTDSDSNFW